MTQTEQKSLAERLIQQGNQQLQTGQYREALKSYEQAIELDRGMGVSEVPTKAARTREANALNNLGIAYKCLSQPQKAIEFYQQALPIYRQIGVSEAPTKEARTGEAKALNNLGIAYKCLSQPQKAIEFIGNFGSETPSFRTALI